MDGTRQHPAADEAKARQVMQMMATYDGDACWRRMMATHDGDASRRMLATHDGETEAQRHHASASTRRGEGQDRLNALPPLIAPSIAPCIAPLIAP